MGIIKHLSNPVGPRVERMRTLEDMRAQLNGLRQRRDAMAEWLTSNTVHPKFLDAITEYNVLCTRCETMRARIANIQAGEPELGRSMPRSLPQPIRK